MGLGAFPSVGLLGVSTVSLLPLVVKLVFSTSFCVNKVWGSAAEPLVAPFTVVDIEVRRVLGTAYQIIVVCQFCVNFEPFLDKDSGFC